MNPSFPASILVTGGAGKQVRGLLHAADLCDLVEEQISGFDRWECRAGNVGGGLDVSVSLQELTAACRKIVGREMPFGSEPENRQADLRIFLADCSRLFTRTHWRPKRGATQIVADVFEWVRAHEKQLQPLV